MNNLLTFLKSIKAAVIVNADANQLRYSSTMLAHSNKF